MGVLRHRQTSRAAVIMIGLSLEEAPVSMFSMPRQCVTHQVICATGWTIVWISLAFVWTASAVVAEQPTVVYSLTQTELARIERDDPAAASAFHRLVVHLLGERVLHLMRAVEALQR